MYVYIYIYMYTYIYGISPRMSPAYTLILSHSVLHSALEHAHAPGSRAQSLTPPTLFQALA